MLTREKILGMTKVKTKRFHVEAWNDEVILRGVSAGEMDHIDSLLYAYQKDPLSVISRVRATACAYFIADASGARIFSDDDIDALDAMPVAGLSEVFDEGMRFNKRASVDDLEKNSETTPSDSSGTK